MSIALVYVLLVGVGLVTVPAPAWRRRAGLALGWLGAAAPLLVWRFGPAEPPLVRFIAGLGAGVGLGRAWELARDPRFDGWRARVFHVVTLFDSRTATRGARELLAREALASTAYYVLAAGGFALAYLAAPASPPALHYAVRWLGGLILLYGVMDGLAAGIRVSYALFGLHIPVLHERPIASRSLGEFWGERWNRPVSAWLARVCFLPLARRRRPLLGLLAAFTVSALLHVYLTSVAVGLRLGLMVGALFVVHGLLVALERILDVTSWAPWAGRAWFLGAMLVTTPLILEPLLRVAWPGR